MNHRRTAGLGLLVFGLGTVITFMGVEIPGGEYEPTKVIAYLAPGHAVRTFALAYLGVASLLGLLAFGHGMRTELDRLGDTARSLTVAAVAVGVVGWFVGAGVVVATTEGGAAITQGIPLPVAHTIGEIAGVVALMMTRTALPRWLKAFSAFAGVCGILAPLFFTFFVFLLWTIVCGCALIVLSRKGAVTPAPVVATRTAPTLG